MSLQVWLPLNGNLNNNGISPVTVTNNGATSNTSGKFGSCYSFDGTNDYLTFTYPSYSTDISFSIWAKFNSLSATHLFEARSSDSVGYQPMYVTSTGIQIGCSSNYYTFSYSFSTGVWYNIIVTHNSSRGSCYINGTLIGYSSGVPGYNFNQDITARIGTRHTSANWFNGYVNDVRIYDECLSEKEIREISKGLSVHYPLSSPYLESTTNQSPQPYKSSYPSCSPGWDTTKHTNAVSVANWGNGYNGGVSSPSIGYHAMWNIIDNIPTVVFQDHNSEVSLSHRWLGVSCSLNTSITSAITAGTKYTISFDIKAIDNVGGYCTAGIYYYQTSSATSCNFHDGCPSFGTIQTVGEWKRVSYTFTRNSSFDGNTKGQSIYIYGMYGTESTKYVRNIQLEIKDHATPYTTSSRSETTVFDTSGFKNNGTLSGTVQVVSNSSPINDKCTNITSATISHTRALLSGTDQEWTCSAWVYPTSTTGSQKLNNFNNGNFIYYSTTQPLLYLNSGDNDYYIYGASNCITVNAWNHVVFTFRNSDGARKIYVNGVDKSSSGPNKTYTPSGIPSTITLFSNLTGYVSDYREYSTYFSADDVKLLYSSPIEISSTGVLHTRGEIIEE